MIGAIRCSECNASYASAADSCAARFDQLLALDHSRREPWGSRHGQAFAAFALQHPERCAASLDAAWTALYRIHRLEEEPSYVFATLRATHGRAGADPRVPERPKRPVAMPAFTIADLGDFAAAQYPARLDAWCQASLRAWGVSRKWDAEVV